MILPLWLLVAFTGIGFACLSALILAALFGRLRPVEPDEVYYRPVIPVGARVEYDQGYSAHIGWTGTLVGFRADNLEFPLVVRWDQGVDEHCCVDELKVLSVPFRGAQCSC